MNPVNEIWPKAITFRNFKHIWVRHKVKSFSLIEVHEAARYVPPIYKGKQGSERSSPMIDGITQERQLHKTFEIIS